MKPVKIKWSNLKDPPDYDLVGYVRGKIALDVIHGVDGWVVYHGSSAGDRRCWAHDGTAWVSGPSNAPPRGKPGAVTREEAQRFAETLVR